MKRGSAHRTPGHFGAFLQGLLGAAEPVALITLPCTALTAVAGRSYGFDAPKRRAGVDARQDVRRLLRKAQAVRFLARLASISAARTLAARTLAARTLALRGPADDPTASLAARTGALGWAMAHAGSARALIFAPGGAAATVEDAPRAAGFAQVIRFRIGGRA